MRRNLRRTVVAVLAAASVTIPAATAHAQGPGTLAGGHARPAPAAAPDAGLPDYDQWLSEVTAVAAKASDYLTARLADGGDGTAIVLDIDNTALESAYGVTRNSITSRVEPIAELAGLADSLGAAVFFVTARTESDRARTLANLEAAGYPIAGLYMQSGYSGSLQAYKTGARIDIEERGYTIVANIGNNYTDLAGGHAERTFKLPDYDGQLG